jgi:hypothetical protein
MKNFVIEITSVPDRKKLVAEIWYNDQMIAEINQEKEELELEFYIKENTSLSYELFCKDIKEAKERLIKG